MSRKILMSAAACLGLASFSYGQAPAPAPMPAPAAAPSSGPFSFVVPQEANTVPGYPADSSPSRMLEQSSAVVPGFWASAEYLLWFTRAQNSMPLVVSVPDNLVNLGNGVNTDQVVNLYPGKSKIRFDAQSGGRASFGYNFSQTLGVDASVFVLESKANTDTFTSNGSPSIARLYTRAVDNTQQILYTALPGQYSGSTRVFADTQFWGADANLRIDWYRIMADSNDLLIGFRHTNLQESLSINDRSDLGGGVINGVNDTFRTHNKFYGGQLGLHTRLLNYGGLSLELFNKIALGGVHQTAQVFGGNTLTGQPDQSTGLLAQASNSGTFSRDKFAAVGEFTVNLGYSFRPNIRFHVGYNLLWQSSVIRPAQTIDSVVNDSKIRYIANPTPDNASTKPSFNFASAASDFWAQGLNLGLTIMY